MRNWVSTSEKSEKTDLRDTYLSLACRRAWRARVAVSWKSVQRVCWIERSGFSPFITKHDNTTPGFKALMKLPEPQAGCRAAATARETSSSCFHVNLRIASYVWVHPETVRGLFYSYAFFYCKSWIKMKKHSERSKPNCASTHGQGSPETQPLPRCSAEVAALAALPGAGPIFDRQFTKDKHPPDVLQSSSTCRPSYIFWVVKFLVSTGSIYLFDMCFGGFKPLQLGFSQHRRTRCTRDTTERVE